ncbi:MAG: c-type cytochrome [Planctomycetaceae bacterium]|nr:c-type cytochrome [Planctomycetaceae bacterium]
MPRTFVTFIALPFLLVGSAIAADGNRLAYLDGPLDPYYPHRDFPKLITPQWVGEEGVECVVTLAIDDMRESAKYEAFLRPILDRLKKIDGRAAVSIMSCRVDPADPQLQVWLKEGLSIEVHTYDHPCPCLQDGGLVKAKETYDKCVDLMNQIPGNKPVAFRMPCCDSKNTPSPRFWAEVFNKTTEKGNFLQLDSSVFNIITSKDNDLPKEITQLPDGTERFRRYVPFANFVNTIEDYPYPYVIGGMCWEFPCVVPSDWSAQHVQKPNNPDTVRDWKLALDACVLKQGVFNLVFHPHGWIRNDQIVELIDHAVAKHGKKVKFLTFKECAERLNKNLLLANALRDNAGRPAHVVVCENNNDNFLDVYSLSEGKGLKLRQWKSTSKEWREIDFDSGDEWWTDLFVADAAKRSSLFRDLDNDGATEGIIGMPNGQAVRIVSTVGAKPPNRIRRLYFGLPARTEFDPTKENGLRLIDINADGKLDCLFSNHERYSLHLFKDMKEGWSIKVIDGVRGRAEGNIGPEIPPFVRADGTNNGAWFHSGALWLMNEDTWRLPDNVFKLTFAEMLGKASGRREPPDGAAPQPAPAPQKASGGREPPEAKRPGIGSQEPGTRGQEPKSVLRRVVQVAQQTIAPPQSPKLEFTPPKSPAESLAALHVRPGMKVELVAAEPLIVDPVAFDWGPDGRLWVVEMHDYPSGITWRKEADEFGKPGGRVKVLTDTDGDGRYDKADTFLDGLPFPTGVKVWRKGILVTAAPSIFYAEDTNGDNKADVRTTLYQGFGEGNQQHRVNGLRWGLDNWLYVGNGDSGGIIKSIGALSGPLGPRAEDGTRSVPTTLEVNVNGRDLRIRPDTGEIDGQSGQTQFGRERDDWGNWFGGNNSNPMWHYTLEDHYLRRNPHVAPPAVRKQVSVSPGAAPVYPRSHTLARFNDYGMANRFTSACSQMIYRDELLGPEFAGNMFVCEPVHNLVSREIVSPQGTTFTGRRAADEQTSEFLASEDNWFRPSMVRTGPDGALYVADMYRFVIEHPKWIPVDMQKQIPDMRAGEDKGRIYRIYPESTKPRPIARLDKLDTAGLVAALDSPNGPQRDLAQQMLLWRADKGAIEPLVKMAKQSKRPQARLQALCTLDGLSQLYGEGSLPDELLIAAMSDDHPGVRRHAVRMSELRLDKSALIQEVMRRADDLDPQVKLQVAYSLGAATCNSCGVKLGKLLVANQDDPYLVAAGLSSIRADNLAEVLAAVMASDNGGASDQLRERLLTMAARMGDDQVLNNSLAKLFDRDANDFDAGRLAGVVAVLDSLDRRKAALTQTLDDANRKNLAWLTDQWRKGIKSKHEAVQLDKFPQATVAVALLARGLDDQGADDLALLAGLLDARTPPALQAAAVTALARTGKAEVPGLLLAGWASHTPAVRGQILDTLIGCETWTGALLEAVEKGTISASQVDARRRQQLAMSKSDAVRTRVEKVLAGSLNSNRQQVVEQYLKATSNHKADATSGKAVFAKRCANCHRLEGVGHVVGPDLAALNNRSRDAMFVAVLDPSRAVEDRYLDYAVRTVDGQTLTGMLREETGTSITLAAAEGKTATILRSEIERLQSSGKSLMPEGVEKDITPPELADLAVYMASNSPPPKQLAGNRPEVVRPFVDGSLRLVAISARVYGPSIVLEEKHRNLGWWSSEEDYAAWSFDGAQEREYRVMLYYACDDAVAGNSVLVSVAGQTVGGAIKGTGSWDHYGSKDCGVVKLPAGAGELTVRSEGPIKGALLDLREVRLVPVGKE